MKSTEALNRVIAGETLSRNEAAEVMIGITRNEYSVEQIAALLTGIQMRGVAADELLGLRDAILETGIGVNVDSERFIDIVGTGGDKKNTFNISTCACIVVAGAGYKVVKHGNFAATSTSGASNVMETLGVGFTSDVNKINKCLNETGFAYLHAPLFAKAMKFVAPIRKALPFPTCFNLLGPLVNPARPNCQLLGVASYNQMRLYADVCTRIGMDYGIINSADGYDEISLTSEFKIATRTGTTVYQPSDIGMPQASPDELRGGNSVEDAKRIFVNVLNNCSSDSQKNVVVANAAFAIMVIDPDKQLDEALSIAKESLESGKARAVLQKVVDILS